MSYIYAGQFVVSEVYDHSNYSEVMVLERGYLYRYYVHLAKDDRFNADFKYPPDLKKLTLEQFEIRKIEYDSYQHRKDCHMPVWRLHKTTIETVYTKLFAIGL